MAAHQSLCINPGCPHKEPHFHFTERDPDNPGNWRTSTHWLDTDPPVETPEPAIQERFPHGSRWRIDSAYLRSLAAKDPDGYEVVGWHDGDVVFVGLRNQNTAQVSGVNLPYIERIPDPPPSPITEPVTLYRRTVNHNSWPSTMGNPMDSYGATLITLLPEGQEPPADAVHRGWWWS